MDAHVARDLAVHDHTLQYAELWARRLPACTEMAPDRAEVTGRLMPSGSGFMTQVACEREMQCCNGFTPDAVMIVPEGRAERVIVDFAEGTAFLPYIEGTSALDCEWSAWREVMARTEVRVTGTWFDLPAKSRRSGTKSRGLRGESICNPRRRDDATGP